MKSIMEEATSITKAIETAWNRAGQPQEFSVKILEHPQTSFFGLKTAKSAKIALFFNELTVKIKEQPVQRPARPAAQPQRSVQGTEPQRGQPQQRTQTGQDNRFARPEQRKPFVRPTQQEPRQPYTPKPERPIRPLERQERQDRPDRQERPERQDRSFEQRETWSPEMVETAQEWLKETLVMMGRPEISVQAQVSHNYLKLTLGQPVASDAKQEETQLKSWGSLAMEAVREKAQKPLRSLRIILESRK